MTRLVSKADYARHRGCHPSAVSHALRSGRITAVEHDGRELIDVETADREWAANTDPSKVPLSGRTAPLASPPPPAPPHDHHPDGTETPVHDIQAARAKREHHEANLAAMREAREAGSLVSAESVARAAADIDAAFAEAAQQLIQLAKELAAESDPVKVRQMIEARVNAALTDAADRLAELAAGRASR